MSPPLSPPPVASHLSFGTLARRVLSVKTFLLAFLSVCFAVGSAAFVQDPNQAPQKHQAAGIHSTSIMGNVSEQREKLRFVTGQRAWNLDNRDTLKSHEGHYVRVHADVYPDTGSIHIIGVKRPTAGESRKNDVQ
jgi:hypothetical protein